MNPLSTVFAAIAVAVAVAASGCPSGSNAGRAPDYAARVRARIAAAADVEVHTLRYNPTPCNCPPFEISLGGRWYRVAFDGADDAPIMQALAAATEAPDAQTRTYALRGALADSLETCAKGAVFVTLSPTAWDDGPQPPTLTPSSP